MTWPTSLQMFLGKFSGVSPRKMAPKRQTEGWLLMLDKDA